MPKFLNNVDLNGNELRLPVIHNLGAAPSVNAKAGGLYFDTGSGLNKLKYHNGTTWVELSSGGSGTWQPYDADLTAIAALTGTAGFLKTDGANGWSVDTSIYLTALTGVTTVNGNHGAITNVALTTNPLNQFAATTSSQLAGVISDETGSGYLVFNTSPSFVTSITTSSSNFSIANTTALTVNIGGDATEVNIGNAAGTVVIAGNLQVDGTTTTVNSTVLSVDDKNIELGSTATPSDITADGGGITLRGTTPKTWAWIDATDSWTSSEHIDLATTKVIKFSGTEALSATQYTGNAFTATTATNVTGGAAGSIVYQTGASTTSTLGLGTTDYVLLAGASAPVWVKKKHSATITAGTDLYTLTHGLGTSDVIVAVQTTAGEVVYPDITSTSTTTTISFSGNTTVNYRVVILA